MGKGWTVAMYDRVNLTAYVPSPAAVLRRLPDARRVEGPDGVDDVFKGRFGCMDYSLKADRLRLRGSLARFAGPDADEPAAVPVAARHRLGEALGIDLGAAKVTRLEVFADLALARPPSSYLPLLLTLPRHKPLRVDGETLKFMTKRRSLQFYDKAAERGVRANGGLMRVELAYGAGGVAESLGHVTLATLAAPDFRRGLAETFHEWYARIEKGHELRLNSSAKMLTTFLQARGVQAEGVGSVLERIAAACRAGEINKQQASSYRRKVLKLARDERFTRPSPLIAELDRAVCRAADAMVR